MAITLRSRREIDLMRKAGTVVATVLLKLKEIAEPGMTTAWLDSVALQMTADAGAEALFKGVRSPVARVPFPGAICASINEQVVHGIPSEDAKLKDGDINMFAQIVCVADAYDAMTTPRVYKKNPYTPEQALCLLVRERENRIGRWDSALGTLLQFGPFSLESRESRELK
jgi:methionyl aminopeptidase